MESCQVLSCGRMYSYIQWLLEVKDMRKGCNDSFYTHGLQTVYSVTHWLNAGGSSIHRAYDNIPVKQKGKGG